MPTERIEADARLLRDILNELDSGEYPALQSAREELNNIYRKLIEAAEPANPSLSLEDELGSFFRLHPDAAMEAKIAISVVSLRFLNEQIAHFSELKSSRPLSEDEKRYGQGELIPIAEKLIRLLDKHRRDTAKGDP